MKPRNSILVWMIALLIAIYALAYVFERNRVARVQARITNANVSELDRQIKQLTFIPKLLSDDSTVVNAITNPTKVNVDLANKRLENAQQESGLDFTFLMNTEGMTIASSNWNEDVSFVGKNYSFRPYFQGALLGDTATYFAVGATTGVPGYFIAEPINVANKTMGVIVTKMSLTALVETWRQLSFETVVLDEFGVIILSSTEQLLYKPTRLLSVSEVSELEQERRYSIEYLRNDGTNHLKQYRQYTSDLKSERWEYVTLKPKSGYHLIAAYIAAISFTIACIGLLLFRNYRQQKRIVTAEQRHSKELEEKIRQRSDELEKAQVALIAESNYSILGRMSAAINHEINQPLASLRLNLASLRKLIDNPSEHVREIEDIVVESDRTTKRIGLVINSLRNYTRKDNLKLQQIRVDSLAEEVVSTLRIERPKMSKHLTVQLCEEPLIIEADRVLVQQALLNLLYNALDSAIKIDKPLIKLLVNGPITSPELQQFLYQHSADGTHPANHSSNGVEIVVEDNGGGVPEQIIPLLFEPFTTEKEHEGGLGLGLTITKQIAESHKGHLLYTQVPNGSRFAIVLPLAILD